MPYDLCEDDPTLDIIETAMANRGEWAGRLPGGEHYRLPYTENERKGTLHNNCVDD